MRPVLTALLTLVTGLVLLVPGARACLNDSDLRTREREFKSDYLDKSRTQPTGSSPDSVSPRPSNGLPLAMTGFGAAFLIGAAVIGARNRTPPPPA